MTPMLRSIVSPALLAIAILFATGPAQAGETDTAPRIQIDLTGVDLSTPEGIDTARHRINGAARALCSTLPDPDGWHLQTSACVLAARDQANRQLDTLQQRALARRTPAAKAGDHVVKTASLVP